MPLDVFKARGQAKQMKPDAGGASVKSVPVLGIVKDNIDPTRQGIIKVYISESNSVSNPDDANNWIPVRYLSPFFGKTAGDGGTDDNGSYKANPSSYGMWTSPPDIGTTVVCIFVNGDINFGYYIGCVPDPDALQMVPAIGAVDNIILNEGEAQSYGGAVRLPVTNINQNNKNISQSDNYLDAAKPVHSYMAGIMMQQGVLRDPIRGPISSSAQRETPSRVGWGVSSPGRPIYEGGFDDTTVVKNLDPDKQTQLRVVARRSGHSIVMDDGDLVGRDNLIRIRTALGHQILMSDDGQTLSILHSNGQSYIELGKEGTVDVFAMNSINMRTNGDINLHADQNVNIHAGKDFNVQAENMHLVSEKEFKQKVGADYQSYTSGKHTTKVDGAYSVESGGDASMASSSLAFINGSKVNLNTGQTSTIPQPVKQLEITAHTDTLFEDTKGWLAAPGKLLSITSRAPAHYPWLNAGQGIDIKVDASASSQLPQTPNTTVTNTNQTAGSSATNPVPGATISTTPSVNAISSSIDKNTTGAMIGQVAADVRRSTTSGAQKIGAVVAATAQGVDVAVGQFASTSKQLENAGTIKPGSAALVKSLAAKTGSASQALQQNLFTGQSGAQNLNELETNVSKQAGVMVDSLQKSQTQLTQLGAITGKEAAQQIGGMIYAAASQGVDKVVSALKTVGNNPVEGLEQNLGNVDGVLDKIGSGNFAAGLSQDLNSALGGIKTSVDATTTLSLSQIQSQAKGAAAAAFQSIANSMKPLKAGVPQNLAEIALKNATEQAVTSLSPATQTPIDRALSNSIGNEVSNLVTGTVNNAQNAVQTGINSITAGTNLTNAKSVASALMQVGKNNTAVAQTDIENASVPVGNFENTSTLLKKSGLTADKLADAAVSSATGKLTEVASSIASGINNLPGGQQAVNAVVNNLTGKINSSLGDIGKITGLTDAINSAATEAISNIAKGKMPDLSDLTNKAFTGLPAGVSSALQGAISALSAGGQVPIKLPTVATNTVNREGLTNQLKNLFGDPGIPQPNFGISEQTLDAAKIQLEENKKFRERLKEFEEFDKIFKSQRKLLEGQHTEALRSLPDGDPKIKQTKQALSDYVFNSADGKKYRELYIELFGEESYNLITMGYRS